MPKPLTFSRLVETATKLYCISFSVADFRKASTFSPRECAAALEIDHEVGGLGVVVDAKPCGGAGETAGTAEGVYVCETDGENRARTRLFFQGPRGSEVSGVCLTPDDRTLFVSVQHTGEEDGSDFDEPSTRWPNFDPKLPPRPAVVTIRHQLQQPIGTR